MAGGCRLGVSDDYEGRTSRLCYSGVMRRGVWQDHDWSVCAVQAFERWAGTTSNQCVSRDGTPSQEKGFSTPAISGILLRSSLCHLEFRVLRQ